MISITEAPHFLDGGLLPAPFWRPEQESAPTGPRLSGSRPQEPQGTEVTAFARLSWVDGQASRCYEMVTERSPEHPPQDCRFCVTSQTTQGPTASSYQTPSFGEKIQAYLPGPRSHF